MIRINERTRRWYLPIATAALMSLCLLQTGCNKPSAAENTENTMRKQQTDIEALARLINLQPEPTSATWSVDEFPESTDWTLFAILEYTPESARRIIESAPRQNADYEIQLPDWVTDKVRNQLNVKNGAASVKEASEASAYISSPLLNGFFVELVDNQILLAMQTK